MELQHHRPCPAQHRRTVPRAGLRARGSALWRRCHDGPACSRKCCRRLRAPAAAARFRRRGARIQRAGAGQGRAVGCELKCAGGDGVCCSGGKLGRCPNCIGGSGLQARIGCETTAVKTCQKQTTVEAKENLDGNKT